MQSNKNVGKCINRFNQILCGVYVLECDLFWPISRVILEMKPFGISIRGQMGAKKTGWVQGTESAQIAETVPKI